MHYKAHIFLSRLNEILGNQKFRHIASFKVNKHLQEHLAIECHFSLCIQLFKVFYVVWIKEEGFDQLIIKI